MYCPLITSSRLLDDISPYQFAHARTETKASLTIDLYVQPPLFCADKIVKLDIDLPGKKVFVTSALSADELLEVIKKTGKETAYVGVKQ